VRHAAGDLFAALTMVAATMVAGCAKPQLTYTELVPDVPPGTAVSPESLAAAARVVQVRVNGIRGAEAAVTGSAIRVGLPAEADAARWPAVACQKGELEIMLMPNTLWANVGPTGEEEWTDRTTRQKVPAAKALAAGRVVFTSADLAREARPRRSNRANEWGVEFRLGRAKKAEFERFTAKHVGSTIAIVLDGKVLMAPVIRSRIPGVGTIEDDYSWAEAEDLAALLRSGPLPFPLREADQGGPTQPAATPP